jgi:hypothetical protein
MIKLSLLEIFLIEFAVWLAFWLYNDYLALLLTIILTVIVFAVLIIALISEWIERSKVPRRYFSVMAVSVLAPVLSAVVYVIVLGGKIKFG